MAKRLKRWILSTLLVASLVFLLAGTWRDPWLWAYVGVWTVSAAYALLSLDEGLAKERFRPPTAGADRIAVVVSAITKTVVRAGDDRHVVLN